MCKFRLIVMAAMCWMALSSMAQALPAGSELNANGRYYFGDLNRDGEVNLSDMNVLMDVILSGDFHYEDEASPNMTIAEFKAKHWRDVVNYADTVTEDEIIHGWVVSSDESGNIYKTLYIMDESGAGLTISINENNLYKTYSLGQEIILRMKGYYVGKYVGQQQVGYPQWYSMGNAWEMGFLPVAMWAEMSELIGTPDASRVQPLDLDLADVCGKTDRETLLKYQGALVRLSNVSFAEANGVKTFAEGNTTTNRYLVDADGNEIVVRNSNYATFASDILPSGDLTVTGILSFRATRENAAGNWQLFLRDRDDVEGGYIDDGGETTDPVTSLNEGFDSGLPTDWLNYVESGDKMWYQLIYQDNGYAAMTGYRGTMPPFDSWLITVPLDIEHAASKVLSFRTQVNAYGSTTSRLEVYLLNDRNPRTATVAERLSPVLATAPAQGYSDWCPSGDIDLSQWADGVYYIAFRYLAERDVNYATWCVDDVKFGD